jgi:membrane associated rhomboid family serine protease
MFAVVPIRTNIWPHRTPYANYALIAVNVIVFLLTFSPRTTLIGGYGVSVPVRDPAVSLMLVPKYWQFWQFLTYAFLHAGYLHIIGNMFFLYLFGNNVNDRLGHLGYLALYLAGAVFSGVGHTLLHVSSEAPTVGASGAVAAVTGAYLVLYPQTLVTVLYWFIFLIGTLDVSALFFIGFQMILWDNLLARTPGSIAYDAHLAGYAFGIAAMLGLLASGLMESSHFDLWSMIVRWDRRRRYKDIVSEGVDPFTGARPVESREVARTAGDIEKEARVQALRRDISARLGQRNLSGAAQGYVDLMALDDQQVLPRQMLLDVANQLASEKRHGEAVKAYEQFLLHYPSYEYAEQVMLMLGLLYSRYLAQSAPAIQYLRKAADRLTDPSQRQLCHDELARLSLSPAEGLNPSAPS